MDRLSGDLACGYQGTGRMAELDIIVEKVIEIINEKNYLKGKRISITAGGTKEDIDPVRYIGNYSSGKMGIALADCAFQSGADVNLISTVEVDKPYKVILVKSAQDMLEATKQEFINADALIMAAAVADYRPENRADKKIKKQLADILTLELVKNADILLEISKIKKPDQTVTGFCAESEDLIKNAEKKIKEKNLDFIVANDISNSEIGFNSDYNEVAILDKSGKSTKIERMPKKQLAKIILQRIFS